MSFEVIALSYSWIHKQGPSSRFQNLYNLINGSYNKPRYKYGIIKSSRIKNTESILLDLSIDLNDEICIYLLLGKSTIFETLFDIDGYKRDLTNESRNVQQAFKNDIPEEYYSQFDLNQINKSSIKFVDEDFEFTDEILNRCIASVGLRSFHGQSTNKVGIKEFELTAFTSFMRNTAPIFLNFIIENCLLSLKNFEKLSQFGSLNDFNTIIIHADVIKEHGLVDYYIKKCSFVQDSQKSDIHVVVGNDMKAAEGIFEDGVLATRDFHISFLQRKIKIDNNVID